MSEPGLSDAVNSVASFKAAVSACVGKVSGGNRGADFEDQVLTIVNEVIPHVKLAAAFITDAKTIDQLMEFAKRFVLSSKALAEQPSGSNATTFAESYDRLVKYLQAASSLNMIASLGGLSPRGAPSSSPRSAVSPAPVSAAVQPATTPSLTAAAPPPVATTATPVKRAGFAKTVEDSPSSSTSSTTNMSKAPSFATVRGKAVSPVAAPPPEEPAPAKVKVNKFQSTYTPAAAPSTPPAVEVREEQAKAKVFRPIASAYGGATSPLAGAGAADLCLECGKKTYPTDRLQADDKVFHKACFRCAHCNTVLKLGSYAALEGKYYCKPHFKQLFALKGNYAEGFGQEKHTAKWQNTGGAPPASGFKGVDQASHAAPIDSGADARRREEERRRQEEETRRKHEEDERRRREDAERAKRGEEERRRREDEERRKRDEADVRRRREEDERRKREDDERRRREDDDKRKRELEDQQRRRREEDEQKRRREEEERRTREEEADNLKLPKMNKVAVAYLAATAQAVASSPPPPASTTTGPVPSAALSAPATTAKKPAALRFQSAYQPAPPPAEEPKKKPAPLKIASTYTPPAAGAADLCLECGKKTYPTDRLQADDKVFHKACFRCAHCNTVLKLGSYAALEGKYYCKPHFKQLFALKGNYAEGFGQEKHTAKWQNTGGAPPASGFKGVDQTSSPSRASPMSAGPGEQSEFDAIAREARDLEKEEQRLEEQAATLSAEEMQLLEEERRLAEEEKRLRDEEERIQKSADISADIIASAAMAATEPALSESKMISNKLEKGKARASVRGPMFTEKCGKCQLEISMMEENMFFKGTFYHVKCFTCVVCNKMFGQSEKYHPRDGQVYCEKDFLAMFFVSNQCAKCQKPLGEQFVDLGLKGQGQGWHPECFGCSTCGAKFPPGASCLNVRGKPYCEPCGRKAFTMRR